MTKPKAAKTKTASSQHDYQLKVTLLGWRPTIWRVLFVPGSTTLANLHRIIQAAMGWEDEHLHEFTINRQGYGCFTGDDCPDPDVFDEEEFTLEMVVGGGLKSFQYDYDFGDCWQHKVTVMKTEPAKGSGSEPKCLRGANACPPEDVGGLNGYAHFLEVIGDPTHPEHEEMKEWVSEPFDPKDFNKDVANIRIKVWLSMDLSQTD